MESIGSVTRKKVVWKDYMELIMNEENDWDHDVEDDTVEGIIPI